MRTPGIALDRFWNGWQSVHRSADVTPGSNAGMNAPGAAPRPYFFYMDAVRGTLMFLGLPYHIARIYGDGRANVVLSDDRSFGFDLLAEFLHSFRMEAFFVVAGFFAAMVLARSQPWPFLRSRCARIGVPLLVCTLAFAPLNAFLFTAGAAGGGPVTRPAMIATLTSSTSPWVAHLWFLHTLLMLTILLGATAAIKAQKGVAGAVVGTLLATVSRWLSKLANGRFAIGGTLLALIATVSWITPVVAERLVGGSLAPFGTAFDPRQMFRYGPMFAFGIALWHQRDLMAWVLRPAAADLPMALVGSIIAIIGAQDVPLAGVIGPFGACLAGFFWAKLLIATAARWLDRPTRLFGTLADAAFSVYLFHFPIVLGLGLAFLRVDWPPVIEFTLILIITASACLMIHAGIRRSALLSFLFNGKPMPA